jgi:hypothetical protein
MRQLSINLLINLLCITTFIPTFAIAQTGAVEFCSSNPGTCATIAKSILNYVANTQEFECFKLSTECVGYIHGGAKSKCHTLKNKIRNFSSEPTASNAKEILDVTGSDSTACMASNIMGCDNWITFLDAHGYQNDFRYACWE